MLEQKTATEFGVRYLDPDTGPLIVCESLGEARSMSSHAACLTWVVPVVPAAPAQVGDPVNTHEARAQLGAPPPQRAEPEPPQAVQASPPTDDEDAWQRVVNAVLRAGRTGRRVKDGPIRASLVLRGWVAEDGYLTQAGQEAADRLSIGDAALVPA